MKRNKSHWYDGKFYDKLLAPNQDILFSKMKEMIPAGSSVLDIGCGTGRLPFFLSDKCTSVTGLDLSIKNINTAKSNLKDSKINNVEFIHGAVEDLSEGKLFDFVIISLVIHEISAEERVYILEKIKGLTDNLIIADYAVDRPLFYRLVNEVVEFAAGKDHYKNYKDFIRNGGLEYILGETGYMFERVGHNMGYAVDIYKAKSNI